MTAPDPVYDAALPIANAGKLPPQHPGTWFCRCGMAWLGTAMGYPDDLYSHARFRTDGPDGEPGAAHDPGLARFRPDVTAPDRRRDGLRDYAQHRRSCASLLGYGMDGDKPIAPFREPCDCGLDAALAEAAPPSGALDVAARHVLAAIDHDSRMLSDAVIELRAALTPEPTDDREAGR
jgi:hypothetical protein